MTQHNPFAPPASFVADISESPFRVDYGLKLGGSILWRVLILQTLLGMPFVVLLSLLELPLDAPLIKLKPSFIYATVALVMAAAMLVWRPGALSMIWGGRMRLTAPAWRSLGWLLLSLYVLLAVANVVVAFSAPVELWVQYKSFGPLCVIIVFCMVVPRLLPRPNPSIERTAAGGLRPPSSAAHVQR
jgi:intracellular septation protein